MLEGIFEINSYEMDDILDMINKTSSEIDEENTEAKNTLAPNRNSGVFGKGAAKINNQTDEIYNQFVNFSRAMQNGTSAVFDTEMKLLEDARNLRIPHGFGTNDSVADNQTSSIGLSKTDGRSVNEGVASHAVNIDGSSVINRENLVDITKDATIKQNLSEEMLDVNKAMLQDITKDATMKREFDEAQLDVNKAVLQDITKQDTIKQEFNANNYRMNQENLYDMKHQETQQVQDAININNVGNVNIKDISQNGNSNISNIELNNINIE